MKKFNLRSGLMATTTIAGALATTMGVTAVVSTVAALAPTAAMAQDYTSGALVGTVTANGAPVANASVTLTSKAQGQTTHLTTTSSGSFTATGLQPGEYDITVAANGYADYHGSATIVISQEVRFEAALATTGQVQTVVVKGHRVRQDFTKTTTGITVDLDTLTAQTPIARSITAVAMLAPTVVQGNPGFGDVASFGGSSVAENAYYIDGLNITNPDTYVGGAQVPFDFYKTVEVKTGGYQAEFGRATGGVINATTKSGTNDFMFAVHGNYQPMGLSNQQADTYDYRGKFTKDQENSLSVEAGGPILKDHLFAYGIYQVNDIERTSAGRNTGVYTDTKNTAPFKGLKLDGYITPTQHLSLTYFDTTSVDKSKMNDYDDDTQTIGKVDPSSNEELGGKNWVLNYSGKVTDWFSISAAIGDAQDRDNILPTDTSTYFVRDYDTINDAPDKSTNAPTTISSQKSSDFSNDAWERKFWRADGDVRFELLGRHHVRFGIDNEKNSELKTEDLVGSGAPVQYRYRYVLNDAGDEVRDLEIVYEHLGGNVASENQAEYIQDSWDITNSLNFQIGVRDDEFKQINLSGQQYMDLKNNLGPRLGFAWRPDADGNWTIHGSYGVNFIPPAMNLGFRGKDLYFAEYFNAPAGGWVIDPTTGLPASIGSAATDVGFTTPCPTSKLASAPGFNATNAAAGTAACTVFGNGTQEGATSKTSEGLKATHVDEVILGANYKINDLWTAGVTGTLRSTKNISEDSDFNDAIISYLNSQGLDSSQYVGGSSYYVWNVGDHGVTIRLKQPLPGETQQRVITLTADQLGHFHDAKREYQALSFTLDRAFDGKWDLHASYTYSRLSGNYSGTVTEYGNTVQTDAGATYEWDSPGMENYSGGVLPGNRTHEFKVYGSYAFNSAFLVGANVEVQSPENFSCLGLNADDAYAFGYGDVSHYCDGQPAPQGKGLKSDWTKNIDVSMRYTVPKQYSIGGKLVLRADIFNLFDTHTILTKYTTYDGASIGLVDSNYGTPTNYNKPRYVRVGFDLNY